MFRITGKKGFHITFENGYTVSVQFGPGNYCDNRDLDIGHDDEKAGARGSGTAEVAVWKKGGELLQLKGWNDTVNGWVSAKDVLKLLVWAEKQKAE